MPFFTTRYAPPEAAPETILTAVPLDFCHALIAGLGPTYAASSWPARIAVVSSVPELKTVVFSSTFLPRFLVKKPLARPTSAGSWVMFARKPSRSTTGDEPEFEPAVALEEAQPAARRVTAATPAVSSTRRINIRLSRLV